jgi:hypothetical protein
LVYTEADAVIVDLDEQQEKALNLALNRISGEWDEGLLTELLKDLEQSGFDLELTGFDGEQNAKHKVAWDKKKCHYYLTTNTTDNRIHFDPRSRAGYITVKQKVVICTTFS